MTKEESRAVAFMGILLGLALTARLMNRPQPMTITAGPVDIAAFREAGKSLSQQPSGRRRTGRQKTTSSSSEPRVPSAPPKRKPRAPIVLYEESRSPAPAPAGPLDLNRASAEDIEKLPGIGPAVAKRIVAYRDSAGRFSKLEDLDAVKGIGPKLLDKLRPLLVVR